MSPQWIEEYDVGWICAIPTELTAARAMLDEEHEPCVGYPTLDNNNYVLGRVGKHNIVIACLPAGVYGTNAGATVANSMRRTFGVRFALMFGIDGGTPNLKKEIDIRLGDVVVSQPEKTHWGVVQYDLRKNFGAGGSERKGFLMPPSAVLLAALSTLQAQHDLEGSRISKTPTKMIQRRPNLAKSGYVSPGPDGTFYIALAVRSLRMVTGACNVKME